MDQLPDWFWSVIEESKPSLGRLAKWLESASKEEIIEFALIYDSAAGQVADYWAGPNVDGVQYSEDDTEDLCNWVVSQGRKFWREAVAREFDLVELARFHQDSRLGKVAEYPAWTADVSNATYRGYLSPEGLAHSVYENRFGHNLLDELDKIEE